MIYSIKTIIRAVTSSHAPRVTRSHITGLDKHGLSNRPPIAVAAVVASAGQPPTSNYWDIETMSQKKVVRPRTKGFYLLKLLLERIGSSVPNDEVIAYMNKNISNIKPTAGRTLTPMDADDLRNCMSRLRVRLQEFPFSKIVIAETECRATVEK